MPDDFNEQVVQEFRANHGRVGGPFAGAPLLLLTTTGAKSGQSRTAPVMYLPDGETMYVFASKGGAPTNPDWYHNLVATPTASVEVGDERFEVATRVLSGSERDEVFARQVDQYPQFAQYQAGTSRVIPVVALRRAS